MISDFACQQMELNQIQQKKNVYGVIPYMALEILRGKPYTQASDIYSLGIIVNEIIAVVPPFNNQPLLALDICRGLRPPIRTETPKFLKELIKECWDAIPKNRPTSGKIINILHDHIKKKQIEELEELSYDFNESTNSQLYETHPQTIYTSRLLHFPNLPEPINCPNQQEFVSSKSLIIQTGKLPRTFIIIAQPNNKINTSIFFT